MIDTSLARRGSDGLAAKQRQERVGGNSHGTHEPV
jgi:hypothetical protein